MSKSKANAVATPAGRDWLSAVEARERLGLTRNQFARLLHKGMFTIRVFPGVRPRIDAADIERVLRQSIKPSSA